MVWLVSNDLGYKGFHVLRSKAHAISNAVISQCLDSSINHSIIKSGVLVVKDVKMAGLSQRWEMDEMTQECFVCITAI